MLSCHDLAQRLASDYVDNQLNRRSRMGVHMHLALCKNCRRYIRQLQRVRAVIRQRIDTPQNSPTEAQLHELAVQLQTSAQQQKNSS